MAIHSRIKFDVTSAAALISPATGYKYQIYGWAMHNNGTGYLNYNSGIDLTIITGNTNIYGVYQYGAGALSYAGVWQLPILESPYFEIPEGKWLFLMPDSTRLSGVLWYEKISTASATVPLRTLLGVGV